MSPGKNTHVWNDNVAKYFHTLAKNKAKQKTFTHSMLASTLARPSTRSKNKCGNFSLDCFPSTSLAVLFSPPTP